VNSNGQVPTAATGRRVAPTSATCAQAPIYGIACGAYLVRSVTPMGTVSAQVFGLEIRVKNMTMNATTDAMDVVDPERSTAPRALNMLTATYRAAAPATDNGEAMSASTGPASARITARVALVPIPLTA
jgi:hypothetical protein